MAWRNNDMELYHGCSDRSLHPNNPNGIVAGGDHHNIDPSVGASRPDFGRGFYTTTWLHQARNWANLRAIKENRRKFSARAVVLRMRVRRNRFAELQSLIFPGERDNFYNFVEYCRNGQRPHADLAHREDPYDIVVGPVTLAVQTMIIGGADQVSFHTKGAVSAIESVELLEIGNPLFDV